MLRDGFAGSNVGALGLALAVPALTCAVHVLQGLGPGTPPPLALELSIYSGALLLAAAIAYLVHWRRPSAVIGRWATGLTFAATIEVGLSVAASCAAPEAAADSAIWPRGDGPMTMLALVCYLWIESAYRDRRAGAFVLPVIACAAVLHAWLVAAAASISTDTFARQQWALSAATVAVLGYSLLAAGGWRASRVLRLDGAQDFVRMLRSNQAGVLILAAAAAGWEWWARGQHHASLFLSPLEPWVLGVLTAYAGHLLLWRVLRPSARQTAGWAAALFLTSTLVLAGTMLWSWPVARI